MKKLSFFMKGLLLPLMYCFGQTPPQAKQLYIGDKVPDFHFTNILNHKSSNPRLSEFKSKLVILDFWSSWCAACISKFPKIQALQHKFSGEAQFILVNTQSRKYRDDEPKIRSILDKVKQRTGTTIKLPVVYNTDVLDVAFPCREVPHLVWLLNNKVVAITGATELTEQNVQSFIAGGQPNLKMKRDRFDVNNQAPLFIGGNGGDGQETLFRSLLTRRMEGITGQTGIRKDGNMVVGVYSWNSTLLSLLEFAFPEEMQVSKNLVFVGRKQLAGTSPHDRDYQKLQESYCYELMLPPCTILQMRQYFQQDMQRYFSASVRRETRLMKCLVLKKDEDVNYTARDEAPSIDIDSGTLKKHIRNYPVKFIADVLNRYTSIPILNETGIVNNVAVNLPYDLKDIHGLKRAFWEIGICMEEQERLMEVAVISFSNPND